MAGAKVPTTIGELLVTATEAAGNIAKHRAAMADVAAQAATPIPEPVPAGGESK